MYYECVVRRSDAEGMALSTRPSDGSPAVQGDTVWVTAERALVDVGYLGRTVTPDQGWQRASWCSLSGHVVEAGDRASGIQVGDRVGAIGPLASHVALPARACLRLPDVLETGWEAWWGLVVALFHSLQRLQIEIGESVLVYGGGVVGSLAAQLSLAAGAGLVVGFAPGASSRRGEDNARATGPTPMWVADRDRLAEALAGGRVDALIDVGDDPSQVNRALGLVREGGRALSLSAGDLAPVDLDFYPNVHRRSLTLLSATLRSAAQAAAEQPTVYAREAGFLAHLIQEGRLDQGIGGSRVTYMARSGETSFRTDGIDHLIVQWGNGERAD
jgi:NADPH:quinone reductase-like Zn-dependent oxidoreductase